MNNYKGFDWMCVLVWADCGR